MTADLLRRAAAKIRETAQAAHEAAPAAWSPEPETPRTSRPVDCYDVIDAEGGDVEASVTHPEAVHIAIWSPDVAELVAAWLDADASTVEAGGDGYLNPDWAALTLARRILGEA